jgi:hypothetical protein
MELRVQESGERCPGGTHGRTHECKKRRERCQGGTHGRTHECKKRGRERCRGGTHGSTHECKKRRERCQGVLKEDTEEYGPSSTGRFRSNKVRQQLTQSTRLLSTGIKEEERHRELLHALRPIMTDLTESALSNQAGGVDGPPILERRVGGEV